MEIKLAVAETPQEATLLNPPLPVFALAHDLLCFWVLSLFKGQFKAKIHNETKRLQGKRQWCKLVRLSSTQSD